MFKRNRAALIPLSVPYLKGNEKKYLAECIDTGWVSSGGPFVTRFEEAISEYAGSRYAVSTSSGTAALHAALLALGIKKGDEVIVPAVTFIATINAVRYLGAHPVFMDCDEYLNMDAQKVKEFCEGRCDFAGGALVHKKTKRRVRAVVPVHIFGHPVNIEPLLECAKKFRLFVIEDAAESLGSRYTNGRYKGKKTGAISDIGCLSFNGNKILTTGGGGMVLTNDKKSADYLRYITNQAKDDLLYYAHHNVGHNYRMVNLQAAVGLAQLEKLDEFIEEKRNNFLYYRKKFAEVSGLSMIEEPPYGFSNYWHYSLVLGNGGADARDMLLGKLKAKGIEARPLWKLNHTQKPYLREESYEVKRACYFYDRVINIPCSVGIKKPQMDKVIGVIRDAIAKTQEG